ncbi:hypothetical protein HHI36_013032 [Cryptolaemus montrouzieri]|uniref:CHHC U11-48K-type domain-containing protein n=1 Tax=Cryptolaemus montrouzieri TaxID=559131 RepID=A0ABD2NG52_9CUCU
MDFNIEIRKKQLESLDQFLTSSRDKLQSILDCLGWSQEKIEEEKLFVNCPYNLGHKILADKLEEHIKKCKVKNAGYNLQENFLSEPKDQPNEATIKLDTFKKIEVLSQAITQTPYFQTAWNGQDADPQTYQRFVTTFSRDERLALYNYCVANTKGPAELPEFDTSYITKKDGDTSYTEEALLSLERDIKRRSVKYKPVHTNNKNYKEVLREVINSQMQQYNDWLIRNQTCKGPRTPECCYDEEESQELVDGPHSSSGRISNSSSSRSTARRREKSTKFSRRDEKRYRDDGSKPYEEDSHEYSHVKKTSIFKSESVDSEHYEDLSRDSSIHSSYKYKERKEKYKNKKQKSRSRSRGRGTKYHHKKRSRSRHRSREHKSHRREKNSRVHSRQPGKYHGSE